MLKQHLYIKTDKNNLIGMILIILAVEYFYRTSFNNLKVSRNKFIKKTTVLIRSPFHYKTSKTVLKQNQGVFKLTFLIKNGLSLDLLS